MGGNRDGEDPPRGKEGHPRTRASGRGGRSPTPADLLDGLPIEVLARITENDPLDLARRVFDRVGELALMVDADRTTALVFATVARRAPELEGGEPPDGWLQNCIDMALRDMLHEDRLEARLGLVPDDPEGDRYGFLSESLGIDSASARDVAVVFNDLALHVRRSFFAMVVDGKSLLQCAEEGLGTADQVREHVRRAFEAISTLGDVDEDEP